MDNSQESLPHVQKYVFFFQKCVFFFKSVCSFSKVCVLFQKVGVLFTTVCSFLEVLISEFENTHFSKTKEGHVQQYDINVWFSTKVSPEIE